MVFTLVSASEMAEVTAAKSTSTKNAVPTNCPPGKDAKTWGMVIKTRPGPAASAASGPPNATTAGMIMRPARNATPVSKISTWVTLESRSSSLRM